ncbi:LacI family DNA-binding transcriptional regulator [Microbacterium insulae]|uniref:LacI family DNA-binding transcriptional regulator n=1 Tax=Microbacterium insulae TaxID=483014 RepID=A0ABW3AHG2_9MICO
MQPITIADVAAATGVSRTTVSHVFSGHRPVRQETRELVLRVAREMGYRPSAVAKSLRARRTNTVMIVIPDIMNPFYPGFARGVQDVVSQQGYHALLCNTDAVEASERGYIEDALARRVDGVVFVGFRVPISDLDILTEVGTAVVAVGPAPEETMVDTVWLDDVAFSREATAYLLRKGLGPVAHITGPTDTAVEVKREIGFRQAHADAGLEVHEDLIVSEEFTHQGGIEGMTALLAGPTRPRSVFCANDLIALGAMRVAHEHGLRVPEDIAFVGVDDIDMAAIANPSLTTVRLRIHELGTICGRRLLERLNGDWTGNGRSMALDAELVVRESA